MDRVKLYRNGKTTVVNAKWRSQFLKTGWREEGQSSGSAEQTGQSAQEVSVDDLVSLVESSDSKDDIESIVLDAKGIDIDKRGGLDAVKKKAIAALTGESDEG